MRILRSVAMFGLSHPKPDLIVHSAKPLNAEPPLDRLRRGFVTKTADFYIRSHGNLPDLDADTHKVRVMGKVRQPLDLTVADLKARFTAKTVTAVMQCAGNRRADMQQVEKTSGNSGAPGAIGNAEWTGVPLADILRAAGGSDGEHLHVAFEAVDMAENEGAKDAPYGVSIPMAKAMTGEVLLAYAMNGEPLTVEHGAAADRRAGLCRRPEREVDRPIRVQDKPSDAFQQAKDYLLFPPDMRKETQDLARGTTIYEMPLNSAICEPEAGGRSQGRPDGGQGLRHRNGSRDHPRRCVNGRRPAVASGNYRGPRQCPMGLDALARDTRHSRRRT